MRSSLRWETGSPKKRVNHPFRRLLGLANAMGITDMQWACQQTYMDLLATIVATGEAKGETWDYTAGKWVEKK